MLSGLLLLTWYSLAPDTLHPNLPYRDAHNPEFERCKIDLSIPSEKKDFPTIIWFHGGGLTGGSKEIPEKLKNQGFAVAGAGYRLSPQVEAKTCIQDAAAAIAWIYKNIASYGGNNQRIYISGHSAGGYLASMTVLDQSWLKPYGIDPNEFAGLIPFSGHSITHFAIRKERGIAQEQVQVDEFAPIFHARKDAPPILLLSGDRELEMLGRYEESAFFARMLKVAGHPNVQLIELQGYDHGGMVEPGLPLLIKFVKEQENKKRVRQAQVTSDKLPG